MVWYSRPEFRERLCGQDGKSAVHLKRVCPDDLPAYSLGDLHGEL
jgi:hypothetical protein